MVSGFYSLNPECQGEFLVAFPVGMALAPWNVLAGGKIRTDAEEERRLQSGEKGRTVFDDAWVRNDKEKLVCAALEKVAGEVGAKHITSGQLTHTSASSRY